MKDSVMEEMTDLARNRSSLYGFLASVYRTEVSSAFLPILKDPQLLGVLSSFGVQLDDDFFSKPDDEVLEDLAVEYARLFLGPDSHISPHESVHRETEDGQEGQLWGPSTVAVKKFIESAGLQYKDSFTDMPDHISVELEFMQRATEREKIAREEENKEGTLYLLKMQKMFLDDHLTKWISVFCDEVIERAELTFYSEIAKLTKSFIEAEKEDINDLISEVQAEV